LLTMWYRARALDVRDGAVNRQAILLCLLLYAATVVLFRQPGWMAVGALVLAMLSEPCAVGGSVRSSSLPAGAKLPVRSGPHARPLRLEQGDGRLENTSQRMES
jgi:hypothetical protein